jgi:hypothetical protein
MFAETFLNYVSRELAWKFASYPAKEKKSIDGRESEVSGGDL